ncbi:MAG TPA: hypothetical protein VGJ41_02240 [Nocardioides sp.]
MEILDQALSGGGEVGRRLFVPGHERADRPSAPIVLTGDRYGHPSVDVTPYPRSQLEPTTAAFHQLHAQWIGVLHQSPSLQGHRSGTARVRVAAKSENTHVPIRPVRPVKSEVDSC